MAYTLIFLLKRMWVAFSFAKASLIFFCKNNCEFDIVLTRTVIILTTNGLVKITMLWTTGPSPLRANPKKKKQISMSDLLILKVYKFPFNDLTHANSEVRRQVFQPQQTSHNFSSWGGGGGWGGEGCSLYDRLFLSRVSIYLSVYPRFQWT